MNAQELQNLSEAYTEVYQEIDEAKVDAGKSSAQKMSDRNVRNNLGRSSRRSLNKVYRGHTKKSLDIPARDMSPTPHGKTDDGKGRYWTKMIAKERSANEEVEIYNIVLSHLLDEGYAETEKAAEAIVENMSEEWMENVVEEIISELRRSEKEGKGSIQSPLGFRGQNRQRGARGGRRWESGGEGGSRRERGKKKNEPGSQHQRLNPPEKKGRQLERGTKAATDRAYGYGQGRYQGD